MDRDTRDIMRDTVNVRIAGTRATGTTAVSSNQPTENPMSTEITKEEWITDAKKLAIDKCGLGNAPWLDGYMESLYEGYGMADPVTPAEAFEEEMENAQ